MFDTSSGLGYLVSFIGNIVVVVAVVEILLLVATREQTAKNKLISEFIAKMQSHSGATRKLINTRLSFDDSTRWKRILTAVVIVFAAKLILR